ncbi:MAG: hypothetical protein ACHQD8_01780 [Chitinophagales bacterium]
MRKIIIIFFSMAIMLFFSGYAIAQEKPKTETTSVKQKDETVRFSLTSSKPFIFGSNRYVLYIGNKEFTRNEQSHKNGKGYMTFLIPADDFNSLQEGAGIYLTYGQVNVEEADMNEMSKNSRRCWSLGQFSKNLLTK